MKIRLLVTDLDGTLVGRGSGDLPLYEDFRGVLKQLRREHGALWVISTGRSLRSFEGVFSPLRIMDILPDFVIVRHAYIYRRTRSGRYRPHYSWNFQIRYHIWSSRLYVKEALEKWHSLVTGSVDHVTTVYHHRNRLSMRFDNATDADNVAEILKKKARGFKYLRVFHFENEVDIRMVPFTKGLALQELAGRLGIPAREILAIGNGHNDISMLDGNAAGMVGCPSNSETDVFAVVNRSGGHIAGRKYLGGVIDVVNAWRDDTVNSALPDWWVETKRQKNPKTSGRYLNHPPQGQQKHNSKTVFAVITVIGIVYLLLLAFANYGILPFSGLIQKPLVILIDIVVKIISWF